MDDAYERKDYATAITKFRSSAEKGDVRSQNALGVMYENGRGVAQDYAEAVRWYRLAAQQGDPIAQHNLSAMYLNGQGVSQDYVRAHMWSNIVAVSGVKQSIEYRDKIASRMTPQQIEQAQRMARECMASNFTKCD